MPVPSVEPTAPVGFDRDPTRSRTLPGYYYFDPAIFELEKGKVFHHSWQYVGHVSMLREPGSYITRNILDQNVLIGPAPQVPNFFFANGFSGHGLQQSPAIGRALSELIVFGQYRTLDLSRLSYNRVLNGALIKESNVV